MRMRYRQVTSRYIDGSQKQWEMHYRQVLSEALRHSHQSMLHHSATWRPLADVLESIDMLMVKIELAGIREEDIEVILYEDALVVSGVRHDSHENLANLCYHEAQIRYGPFRVEVFIPTPVQYETVEARYENGILRVDLPKLSASKPARISVQNGEINK